jgi:hypothetical protein
MLSLVFLVLFNKPGLKYIPAGGFSILGAM